MYKGLKNKVVIVTGSSHGIGNETGRLFLKYGSKVVFVARGKEKLEETKKTYGTKNALYLVLDLTKENDCKKLISETKKKFGKIDVLVNNVGRGFRGMFDETDVKTFEEVFDINFSTALYCTKYAYDEILKNKGSIVFISSIAGIRGLPCYGPYGVAKSAINTFSQILDVELGKKGIHVGRLVFGPVENQKEKEIERVRGSKDYTSFKILVSLKKASMSVVKCVAKRRRLMRVGFVSKTFFILNYLFPGIVRIFLKKFNCPDDYN